MKLSEVIKAIEDGSKSKYSNDEWLIQSDIGENENIYLTFGGCITPYTKLDGWEEVKPPRQWSEKELMLFKLFPDWAKWISRDRHSVYVSQNKPVKLEQQKTFSNIEGGMCHSIEIFDFLTITFEESPVYIGDLKGE